MKSIVKKSNQQAAFTIVELLTVMSIIVILIGLLVPALNQVKKFAKEVKQRAQFHSISAAIELFNSEFDTFPESSMNGPDGNPYCGAMKLAEAMVGQDLMGFHPDSVFNSNGENYQGRFLYDPTGDLSARKGPYLPIDNANAYRMDEIYANYDSQGFLPSSFVLCDVFGQVVNKNTGLRIGMPILYYKSRPSKLLHSSANPDNSIYNYMDNHNLVALGKPWDSSETHRFIADGTSGERFYENTWNDKVTTTRRPFNEDTYLLISAGLDGDYGTADDICNFDFKYKEIQ